MDALRKGDVLVIWKLDRLGRSLKNLIEIVNELLQRKVGLKSLNDPIDTTTSTAVCSAPFLPLWPSSNAMLYGNAPMPAWQPRAPEAGRAAVPKGLGSSAEQTACAAERLCVEIVGIIDEQGNRLLPLPDKVAKNSFTPLRLCRYFEILFGGQIVKQGVDENRQAQLARL